MIIPKKPQILYAPMLATFGGGSVRAFRSAATGPVPADFFENGVLTNSNHWQQKTGIGGVNSFTFSSLSGLFSTYKHLMFYATGPGAGGSYYGGGGGAGAACAFIWSDATIPYFGQVNSFSGTIAGPTGEDGNQSNRSQTSQSDIQCNGSRLCYLQGAQNGGSYHYSKIGGGGGYISSLYQSYYQDHWTYALVEDGPSGSAGNSGITKAPHTTADAVDKITAGAGGQGSANYGSLDGSGEGGDAGTNSPCTGGGAGYALSQGIRSHGADSSNYVRIRNLLSQGSNHIGWGNGDGANSSNKSAGGGLALILGLT